MHTIKVQYMCRLRNEPLSQTFRLIILVSLFIQLHFSSSKLLFITAEWNSGIGCERGIGKNVATTKYTSVIYPEIAHND
jgi:hypothetical protein